MMVEQPTRAAISVRIPLWITIVVILGALLSLVGAVVSKVDPTLLTSGGALTDAARVYADYTFARDLAVSIVLLALLTVRARLPLASVMTLVALIQIIDTLDDLTRGAFVLAPGLLIYAILFLLGAWMLAGQPRWRRSVRRAD